MECSTLIKHIRQSIRASKKSKFVDKEEALFEIEEILDTFTPVIEEKELEDSWIRNPDLMGR